MAQKPAVLITGVSGNLGLRLLEQIPDFHAIGVDVRPPATTQNLVCFENIDLREERSCTQLLKLLRAYRPDAIVHLAFVAPARSAIADRERMRQANVSGTARVLEAIAEHNRILGGISKFIFPSSTMVYGPGAGETFRESTRLAAQDPLASSAWVSDKIEADLTIQSWSNGLKCRSYILRCHGMTGTPALTATAEVASGDSLIAALRGIADGEGSIARRRRERGARTPVFMPAGGTYLDHPFQFVHIDDAARLIATIVRRIQTDPQLTILNVAGRDEAIPIHQCAQIANTTIRRVPGKALWRRVLGLLWDLGVSAVPPETLPYLLGSCVTDNSRLRQFLGDDYREIIRFTCAEALAASFPAGGIL